MKKVVNSWCAAVMAAAAAIAVATPASAVTWTDNIGYVNNFGTPPAGGFTPVLVTAPSTHTYTHDITDAGFVQGNFQITSVALDIWLADDSLLGDLPLLGDASEKVSFRFDGNGDSWTQSQQVDGTVLCILICGWDSFSFSPGALLTDGLLKVDLKATQGDFYFKRSLLTVTGQSVAVPEPGTLALLGMGLVGVGFAARRRRQVQ